MHKGAHSWVARQALHMLEARAIQDRPFWSTSDTPSDVELIMHSWRMGASNLVKIPAFGFIKTASRPALGTANNGAWRKGAFPLSGENLLVISAICIVAAASLCLLSQWQMGLQQHPTIRGFFSGRTPDWFVAFLWVTRLFSSLWAREAQGLKSMSYKMASPPV